MISYPPEHDIVSPRSQLLQTALHNHALEARRRRGRGEQPKSLDLTGSSISKSLGFRSSLEVENMGFGLVLEQSGSRLFSSTTDADLRRHHHIRRKRHPNPPLSQPFQAAVSTTATSAIPTATPTISSAPPQLHRVQQQLPHVAPLRITPKTSSRRFTHARSQSAPAVTPVDSPGDSILSFYLYESSSEGDSDSEAGSICSAPMSTSEEISMNMFLARGDSIDSWPSEFPVEALEEEQEFEVAGRRDIGEPGLKRQNTEAVVQLLRARRFRAGAASTDIQI